MVQKTLIIKSANEFKMTQQTKDGSLLGIMFADK